MERGVKNYYQAMNQIYGRLQDEESQTLFEMRINYLMDRDQNNYMEELRDLYHDWRPSKELDEKISRLQPKEIIIFGCGYGGRTIRWMLPIWGYQASCFCDNYKSGENVDGLEVLSLDEMINNHKDYLVIISSFEHAKEIYDQLIGSGIEEDAILNDKMLVWSRGNQYLDVFEPRSNEIYVDAGAFDGADTFAFCRWTDWKYKKIYTFEPIKSMCDVIQKRVKTENVLNVEVYNNAVWDKQEILMFTEAGASSSQNGGGRVEISAIDIDFVVKEEKVSFIKMDVEGSELKALQGAKQTIIKNRPRLAICIYHKPEDIIEIPFYILSLVPDYKFYIRHYSSHMWETVLYAEI